jgi:hypothetical protein
MTLSKDSSHFMESINPRLAEYQHFLATFCMTPSLWPIDMPLGELALDLGEFKGAVNIEVVHEVLPIGKSRSVQ